MASTMSMREGRAERSPIGARRRVALAALACVSVALGVLVLGVVAASGALGAAPPGALAGMLGLIVLPGVALASERSARRGAARERAIDGVGLDAASDRALGEPSRREIASARKIGDRGPVVRRIVRRGAA